jgi:hypothetical protein
MTLVLGECWLEAFGDVNHGAGSVLGGRWDRSVDAGVCPGDGMAGGFKASVSVELSQLIVSPGVSQGVMCCVEV